MVTIDNILNEASWFPHAFSPDFSTIEFVKTNATTLRQAPFLDERFLTPAMPRQSVSVADLLKMRPHPTVTPPMIFHSAFCCSTLMAKALDKPGMCLSLKEPNILMSLANAKRMLAQAGQSATMFQERYDLVMTLLAREFTPGETILLKPTNAVNNLLEDAKLAGSPVMLMYAHLDDFLVSVLKKGEACKSFMRTQYNIFTLDPCALAGINPRQAMTFTDLQVATLVWRHQLELFHKLKADVFVLRDGDFLSDIRTCLGQAAKALQLNHSKKDLDYVVAGPVFARDVKFEDKAQNAAARADAASEIRARYANELESTLQWAKNLRLEGDVLS